MVTREFSCQDAGFDCEFMIRSEDEDQLVEFVKQHASEAHDTEISSADVQGMWKEA